MGNVSSICGEFGTEPSTHLLDFLWGGGQHSHPWRFFSRLTWTRTPKAKLDQPGRMWYFSSNKAHSDGGEKRLAPFLAFSTRTTSVPEPHLLLMQRQIFQEPSGRHIYPLKEQSLRRSTCRRRHGRLCGILVSQHHFTQSPANRKSYNSTIITITSPITRTADSRNHLLIMNQL